MSILPQWSGDHSSRNNAKADRSKAFDADMSAARFHYTLIGGKIIVADPASHKVIWILE